MEESIQQTRNQNLSRNHYCFLEERLFSVILLALSLFSTYFLLHPYQANAQARVSGSCASSHCYATMSWSGHTYGFESVFTVAQINGGDGFATNASWVIDTNPNEVEDCRAYSTSKRGYCWIEAEYKAFGTDTGQFAGTTQWIWAEVKPGYLYVEHDEDASPVPSSLYGTNTLSLVEIYQLSSNSWAVQFGTNSSDSLAVDATSTNNTMYADALRVGMELSGTQGWSATPALFGGMISKQTQSDNGWAALSSGTVDPITPPAYGYWDSANSFWYTCVQGAGC